MSDLARAALLAQLATTLPLVGLIWFVQIVAYPLFAHVDVGRFASYHAAHSHRITFVVAPLMIVELGAALAYAFATGSPLSYVSAGLAAVVWVVTFACSVPQHDVLSRGFDARAQHLLVATNWLRTFAWTARGAIVLWTLAFPA